MANMDAAISGEKKKAKPRGAPFKKGQSGNPTGRPKLPEDIKLVRELARQYTAQAVETLAEVMVTGSSSARVSAANAILERGWGKPEQPVTGPDGGDIPVTLRVIFEDGRQVSA